jgi:tetratricopeptide (TPR) repeat protein
VEGQAFSVDQVAKRPTPIIRDVDALLRNGLDLIERNRFEQAASLLRQAAGLQPDTAMVQLALGIALGRLLRIPEATAALERAAELDPTGFYPRFRLGELYLRIGLPTRAQEELQRAMDLSTDTEQRQMVRNLLAADARRDAKRAWRPNFLRRRGKDELE